MKLVQIRDPELGPRVGMLRAGFIYDLTRVEPNFTTTVSIIEAADGAPAHLLAEDLASRVAFDPAWRYVELDRTPGPYPHLAPPIQAPEIWGAGLTYERSRTARETESLAEASYYTRAYTANRPELFLKTSNMLRVAGPNEPIGVRTDSRWIVPEPELVVVVGTGGEIVGYTIGNDVTARDIEGENPLYLPQAKVFRGCCALGPVLLLATEGVDPLNWTIQIRVTDGVETERFVAETSVGTMRRSLAELVSAMRYDNDLLPGTALLTGTGIVPNDEFSLESGNIVEICIEAVGVLRNPVLRCDDNVFLEAGARRRQGILTRSEGGR